MKSTFLHSTLAVALLGSFALASTQASAAYVQSNFNFEQHSGFLVDNTLLSNHAATPNNDIKWYDFTNTGGGYANGNTSPVGTFDTIAWGLPSVNNGGLAASDPFLINTNINTDYSGLRVSGLSGLLTTGLTMGTFGDWESISTTYHRNQTISASAYTLTAGVIYSELLIVELGASDNHGLPFTFLETMNQAMDNDPANCAAGAPQGTICDDLFKFPSAGFAPIYFSYNGKNYEMEFGIGNFQNASTNFPGCDSGPQCTVWTAEEQVSSLDVLARIREIPEPSTVALLGAALLGLGLRRRKS
jgi:hypothetical protein